MVVADVTGGESVPHETRFRLDLSDALSWWSSTPHDERGDGRWLAPLSFHNLSAARINGGLPAVATKMNRRFLPMPTLRWSRPGSLISRHGLVAIHPSLILGRRLTASPEIGRGGRTIGLGVQVRIWLDDPPATANTAAETPPSARILATVRGMLEKR